MSLWISVASDQVIVHHARRLHEGIADRRPNESESTLLQILAHRVGLFRPRRDLFVRLPSVQLRTAAHKSPDVGIEAHMLLLNG